MLSKNASVLVVDDDIRMLRMMKRIMELEGFHTIAASSGEASLKLFEKESPDLVLLDIMMPDMDGYSVCQRIREFSKIPIIMVTAKGNDKEKVEGLDIGADDYITKPFSTNELAARVRAVLRRTIGREKPSDSVFKFKDLIIDFSSHRVMVNDMEIELTPTEYKVLSYMSCNAGRVVTPDQLLDKVWGEEYLGDPHLLQVNIARLRRKLGDDAKHPSYILTRPGIGYMIPKQ
jgi:DNA-binding response OmpR family regulator